MASGMARVIADQIIEKRGLKQVSDSGALESMVAEVLASNQAMVDDYINTDPDKRKKETRRLYGADNESL